MTPDAMTEARESARRYAAEYWVSTGSPPQRSWLAGLFGAAAADWALRNIAPPPGTVEQINRAIAEELGLSRAVLEGRRRDARAAFGRHLAVWLCVRFAGLSQAQTARIYGRRDHTTALNSLRRIDWTLARGNPANDHESIHRVARRLGFDLLSRSSVFDALGACWHCGCTAAPVRVHGHWQCARCRTVIERCCETPSFTAPDHSRAFVEGPGQAPPKGDPDAS